MAAARTQLPDSTLPSGAAFKTQRQIPTAEQLLGELAGARLGQRAAEVDVLAADQEAANLAGYVVTLEAERRALRQEVERLNRRVQELEQNQRALDQICEEAQRGHAQAVSREKVLALRDLDRQLNAAQAENTSLRCRAEVNSKQWEVEGARRILATTEAEVSELKEALRAERSTSYKKDLDQARQEIARLEVAEQNEKKGREMAEDRARILEVHVDKLEQNIRSTTAREVALRAEVQVQREQRDSSEAVSRRLRLDLQEVTSQAIRGGERPYYTGCSSPDSPSARIAGAPSDSGGWTRALDPMTSVVGSAPASPVGTSAPLDPASPPLSPAGAPMTATAFAAAHGSGLQRAGLESLAAPSAGGAANGQSGKGAASASAAQAIDERVARGISKDADISGLFAPGAAANRHRGRFRIDAPPNPPAPVSPAVPSRRWKLAAADPYSQLKVI